MLRFAYEVAENLLNKFVGSHPSQQFKHAYYRLKLFVRSIALGDYVAQGFDKQQALSFAWEDAEMAFRGQSEPSLGGVILQMWVHVEHLGSKFKAAIEDAFAQANAATPIRTIRRYTMEDRRVPVITSPRAVFQAVLPGHGPLLRAWAADNNEDIEALEADAILDSVDEQTYLMNQKGRKSETPAKRGRRSSSEVPPVVAAPPAAPPHRTVLRLVHNTSAID
jgi:hypothetical protein